MRGGDVTSEGEVVAESVAKVAHVAGVTVVVIGGGAGDVGGDVDSSGGACNVDSGDDSRGDGGRGGDGGSSSRRSRRSGGNGGVGVRNRNQQMIVGAKMKGERCGVPVGKSFIARVRISVYRCLGVVPDKMRSESYHYSLRDNIPVIEDAGHEPTPHGICNTTEIGRAHV